jgi:cell division protein FtsW (lipid II flippase)
MRVDYHVYREPAFIWTALAVVSVCLVGVLFSAPVNNARRWFGVGGLGIQPSELAKLAAIFFTAALLERRMHRVNEVRYALLPIGIVVGGLVGLILLEPDYGTAMSLALIAAILVFAAGLNYTTNCSAWLCHRTVCRGRGARRRRWRSSTPGGSMRGWVSADSIVPSPASPGAA